MKLDTDRLRAACLFCNPAAHGQAEQVLLRSDNFYIFAGLGAIVEGYLILTPYACKANGGAGTCLADLSADLLDELVFLRGLVSTFYLDRYGHPGLSFEHGRAGVCGQLDTDTRHCYHPHLCCYPGLVKSWSGFVDRAGKGAYLWDGFALPNRRVCEGLHTLPAVVGTLPYLYIEHYEVQGGKMTSGLPAEARVFITSDAQVLESQFLRRRLAELVGDEPKWDWAAYPTPERVDNVACAFRDWLKAHAADYAITYEQDGVPRLSFTTSAAELTGRAYERIAGSFKERWQGTLQYNTLGRFLSQIPAGDSGGAEDTVRILDAGCGPGLYAKVFADLGFECTAVDPSSTMLQEARQYLGEGGPRSATVKLVQARVEDLSPFAHGHFEAIWFSAVLLHIPRRAAGSILRTLSALLTDGGVLYVLTRLVCDERGRDFPALEVRREGRVFVYYQERELERLFADAGLTLVESWKSTTAVGTLGDRQSKPWCHYLLRKNAAPGA